MQKIQEYKIEYNGCKVFFFEHNLKSAKYHALQFIERNKNKGFKLVLFKLNGSNVGDKWILISEHN